MSRDGLLQVIKVLESAQLLSGTAKDSKTNQGYPCLDVTLMVPYAKTQSESAVELKACITFGDVYGPQHAIDTAVQLQTYKCFRPLFLFLRALLRQRGLDTWGNAEGLPPYILYSMVRSTAPHCR